MPQEDKTFKVRAEIAKKVNTAANKSGIHKDKLAEKLLEIMTDQLDGGAQLHINMETGKLTVGPPPLSQRTPVQSHREPVEPVIDNTPVVRKIDMRSTDG